MRWLWMLGLGIATTLSSPAERRIWLVLSPESRIDMARLRRWPKPSRIVLAVEDFRTGRLPDSFLQTVKDLQEWIGPEFDLPVLDPEALDVVRKLGVRKLPALVLFDAGKLHVVEGLPPSPKEVLECPH